MASFKTKNKDEIATAETLTYLSLSTDEEGGDSCGDSSTWRCAFSPDETYFAWSCGNSKVALVPWDRLRQSPSADVEKGDTTFQKSTTIFTRYKVVSIVFGSTNKTNLSSSWWTRWSVSKHLILATGHKNGYIRTWDVVTGKLILHLTDHRDSVTDLSFTRNGSLILLSASTDHTLKIWDVIDNGNMFKTIITSMPVTACCWSPNANLIASVGGNKAYLWEADKFTRKVSLEGHTQKIVSCEFSSDGNLIATASSDSRVILWQVQTGKILSTFGHYFPQPSIFFSPGKDGNWIRGLSFSQDGIHIATVAEDGYTRFWNILSNDEHPVMIGESEDPVCCAFTATGSVLAVGSSNGIVTFWKANNEVRSLKHASRLAISKYIQPCGIEELFLPQRIKDYLLYKT